MTTLTRSLWLRDDSVPLSELTVGGLLAERAAQFPGRLALVATGHDGERRRLSYAELLAEAQRVAAALAELAAPGEYVALWAPNVAEWPIIQYGAALAGVVLVALNPVLREAELEYALAHSGAVVLIHAEASRDYQMAPVAASVAARCPALRHVISLADRSRWRAEGPGPSSVPGDPDAPVMLQYTSGTTGLPKGVLLRHRSLVNNARLTLGWADIAPGSVAVNPLPMFHTAGCVISTLGPLWIGGTMVLIGPFAPAAVLAELRAEQATVLFYVPAVLGALLEAQRASPEPAPRLRTVIGGASFVPAAMIQAAERTFGASVLNVFGQTELAPVLTGTRPDDPRREQLETVGRPLPHADCGVLDPVTGAVQPLGVPGEICARGYQQMICYLHDEAATKRAVDPDGFLHTGDLGWMDARGYVTVTGRLKELIIRGGENIAPAEIEECLLRHPDVAQVAVFGVPDERLGEIVAAAVRVREPARPDGSSGAAGLAAHCRARLSPHKIPALWYAVTDLPVTPTGKVQRFRLREQAAAGALPPLP